MVVWAVTEREKDIECFYELLKQLEDQVGGKRTLADCHWNMGWPKRGVYFFFEDGETRSKSSGDLRVVRVGTHAVTARSKSQLWHRLYEHKQDGGRSVFRDHVNRALKNRSKGRETDCEHNHTRCISTYIGGMPFLWVDVDAEDGYKLRRWIESNAIGLLSNWRGDAGDCPSEEWLGKSSEKVEIQRSGLWNVQHTKSGYKSEFLNALGDRVSRTGELQDLDADWDSPLCIVEEIQ